MILFDVVCGGDRLVAVGSMLDDGLHVASVIVHSTDGDRWERASDSPDSDSLAGVA